jgi:hypothetical protein
MRVRLAIFALASLTLSCQSDPPLEPNAVRSENRSVSVAGAASATPIPTPAPVAPAVVLVALPTSTPTPAATPAPQPTSTPVPVATATPRPTAAPTPSDPLCLDLATVPSSPVPIFTGRGCKTSEGFVPVRDPGTGADGCIRNWRCADGDERFQPVVRIGGSLNGGGPGGVHRCNAGEGFGPEYICDTGRPGQEAYGRNITDAGGIIQPATEPDGRVPGAWERAGICRPVICAAAR